MAGPFHPLTVTHRHSPSPITVRKCVSASTQRPVSSPNVPPAGEGEEEWREEPVNGSLQAFLLRGLKAGPSYRVRLVARGGDRHQPAHLSEELVVRVPGEGALVVIAAPAQSVCWAERWPERGWSDGRAVASSRPACRRVHDWTAGSKSAACRLLLRRKSPDVSLTQSFVCVLAALASDLMTLVTVNLCVVCVCLCVCVSLCVCLCVTAAVRQCSSSREGFNSPRLLLMCLLHIIIREATPPHPLLKKKKNPPLV